ncbi:hypothetical protein [Pseudoalteromonas sp. KAN5]|uniref:hypothetical protein n=1 Tax=Pseudoalteromonas sp. KAN5 TaxID=2916633 RepID=UPI001FCCA018|nr:hypothetical protein [Pseudoalteromonas sp. KAN5]BDF95907.1 hypothetical protein KAN5_27450 [Pseudoalteromonas sp. KAN5]
MKLTQLAAIICLSTLSFTTSAQMVEVDFHDRLANNEPLEQVIAALITTQPGSALTVLELAMNKTCTQTPPAADEVLTAVINALGSDHEQIESILKAAIKKCIDSDSVTVVAIAAGVDPSLASLATASGGAVSFPATTILAPVIPTGSGSGGDSGISEVNN